MLGLPTFTTFYYGLVVNVGRTKCWECLELNILVNTHFLALTRPVVLDYIWSAENGGDIGFAQCHLVWTGLPDLGLPGPKSSFSNFSGKLVKNF